MAYRKIYVEVVVRCSAEGVMTPLQVIWRDGRVFDVARVLGVERAAARVDAVLPIRFRCLIGGRERFLYFEPDRVRWFVEAAG